MVSRQPRYRFVLVEESETLPVVYRRPRPRPTVVLQRADPLEALVEAFATLNRRSDAGEEAWAPALSNNPLSFLLDSLADAVVLRREDGTAVYRNRAAAALSLRPGEPTALQDVEISGRRYRRRCMVFRRGNASFLLEVLQTRSR